MSLKGLGWIIVLQFSFFYRIWTAVTLISKHFDDVLMTGHSQQHSISYCCNEVFRWHSFLYFLLFISIQFSMGTFFTDTYINSYCGFTWATGFCFLSGLTCKYRSLLLSKSPCLPTGRWGGTVPSLRQIWLSFVFWVKAIVAFSFKVCVFYLYSNSFMEPLVFMWQKQLRLLCCNSAKYGALEKKNIFTSKSLFFIL